MLFHHITRIIRFKYFLREIEELHIQNLRSSGEFEIALSSPGLQLTISMRSCNLGNLQLNWLQCACRTVYLIGIVNYY